MVPLTHSLTYRLTHLRASPFFAPPDSITRTGRSLRDTPGEAAPDARLVQFLADEGQLAGLSLADVPEPVGPRVEHHLHALEDHSFGLALDLQNSLAAVNLLPHLANHFAEPGFNLL